LSAIPLKPYRHNSRGIEYDKFVAAGSGSVNGYRDRPLACDGFVEQQENEEDGEIESGRDEEPSSGACVAPPRKVDRTAKKNESQRDGTGKVCPARKILQEWQ